MNKRADALQNRSRILDAAAAVFAEVRLSAPLDLVRERAGVGRATLYRNYKDRDALMQALMDSVLLRLETVAQQVQHRDDALFAILDHVVKEMADSVAVFEYWNAADMSAHTTAQSRERLHNLLIAPLARGQKAGLVAEQIEAGDIFLAFRMIAGVLRGGNPEDRKTTGKRALALLTNGLAPRHADSQTRET